MGGVTSRMLDLALFPTGDTCARLARKLKLKFWLQAYSTTTTRSLWSGCWQTTIGVPIAFYAYPIIYYMYMCSESPYGFHMCWTANKRDKIKYFKETGMWYLQDKCYISDLTPAAAKSPKSMFNKVRIWARAVRSAHASDNRS